MVCVLENNYKSFHKKEWREKTPEVGADFGVGGRKCTKCISCSGMVSKIQKGSEFWSLCSHPILNGNQNDMKDAFYLGDQMEQFSIQS